MARELYRYRIEERVPPDDVEATIVLAVFSLEALHGEAQVRLDLSHHFDAARNVCVLDAGTPVGRDFNRLVCGYLTREFGPDSFRVERLTDVPAATEPKPELVPA